jgi:hypothetical protein
MTGYFFGLWLLMFLAYGVLCFGPRETSRIKRMVESAAQEGMAQAQSLHDARLTNGASPEPVYAS